MIRRHSNRLYLQIHLLFKERDWNWRRTIEIIELILSEVKEYVKKWNFNRYQEAGGPLYVTLRLDIEPQNRNKIETVLKSIKIRGIIADFKLSDQPWDEPYFVILAHELATESALRFKHEVDKHDDLLRIVELRVELHRVISFFYCLMRYLLAQLNFKVPRLWEYERHSPIDLQRIDEIAKHCIPPNANILLERLRAQDRGSFLERYIHCFFNCIGKQVITINVHLEAEIKRRLLNSILWELMGQVV